MYIHCRCCACIVDQTEALPHKGHILSNQGLIELIYQCTECGRLYIQDHHKKLHDEYSPIESVQKGGILSSAQGEESKKLLVADWNDGREEGQKGYLFCNGLHLRNGYISSFEELERKYYKQLDELLSNDALRSARLKYNDEIIHRFW